jgi:hypothetical protein
MVEMEGFHVARGERTFPAILRDGTIMRVLFLFRVGFRDVRLGLDAEVEAEPEVDVAAAGWFEPVGSDGSSRTSCTG